jgi:hypothetical protein
MHGPKSAAFDTMVDYACGDIESFRKKKNNVPRRGREYFHFQLVTGEPETAVTTEDIDQRLREWPALLAVSLAHSLAGNQQPAEEWLTRACDQLRAGDADEKRAAELLEGKSSPTADNLDEITLLITDMPLLLATLARRLPEHRDELNNRAARLNISRHPPYLLVKKALEQP